MKKSDIVWLIISVLFWLSLLVTFLVDYLGIIEVNNLGFVEEIWISWILLTVGLGLILAFLIHFIEKE